MVKPVGGQWWPLLHTHQPCHCFAITDVHFNSKLTCIKRHHLTLFLDWPVKPSLSVGIFVFIILCMVLMLCKSWHIKPVNTFVRKKYSDILKVLAKICYNYTSRTIICNTNYELQANWYPSMIILTFTSRHSCISC